MHVIICGSRKGFLTFPMIAWLDALVKEYDITTVVTGGASGIDASACQWAKDRGLDAITFWANWTKYPKAAGPIRNEQMVKYLCATGKRIRVIAFPGGVGTTNCVETAQKYAIEVLHYAS